jgi:hypothetical protein
LIHFMRLSLMKGAHADLSSTAWQEIGVKPYFGLSGIMALDVPLPVCRPHPTEVNRNPMRQKLGEHASSPDDHILTVIMREC